MPSHWRDEHCCAWVSWHHFWVCNIPLCMYGPQSLQWVRTPLVQTSALPAFRYDFHLFVRSFHGRFYDSFVGTLKVWSLPVVPAASTVIWFPQTFWRSPYFLNFLNPIIGIISNCGSSILNISFPLTIEQSLPRLLMYATWASWPSDLLSTISP